MLSIFIGEIHVLNFLKIMLSKKCILGYEISLMEESFHPNVKCNTKADHSWQISIVLKTTY